MPPKRCAADWEFEDAIWSSSSKRPRVGSSNAASRVVDPVQHVKPQRKYKDHPESGVGKQFHSVPYPLSLLHKKSWEAHNQGEVDGGVCSKCGKARQSTPHERKLFLVAERLSWELDTVSTAQRSQNEVNLWSVNATLDIFDPAVDDEDVVLGGRRSRIDEWYPYKSKTEALMAMRVVEKAEILTKRSWNLWKNMADSAVQQEEQEIVVENEDALDLTGGLNTPTYRTHNGNLARTPLGEISPNSKLKQPLRSPRKLGSGQASTTSTPPSSRIISAASPALKEPKHCSIKSLQDFYSLLDKIERTSPMGAKFLEAYAERLHFGSCRDCWFEKNVVKELMEDEPEPEPSRPRQEQRVVTQNKPMEPPLHSIVANHYAQLSMQNLRVPASVASTLQRHKMSLETYLGDETARATARPDLALQLRKCTAALAQGSATLDQLDWVQERLNNVANKILETENDKEAAPPVRGFWLRDLKVPTSITRILQIKSQPLEIYLDGWAAKSSLRPELVARLKDCTAALVQGNATPGQLHRVQECLDSVDDKIRKKILHSNGPEAETATALLESPRRQNDPLMHSTQSTTVPPPAPHYSTRRGTQAATNVNKLTKEKKALFDPVTEELAERSRSNPTLRALLDKVAKQTATPAQVSEFKIYVDELTVEVEKRKKD